ncbi:hypothetical protein OHA72_06045 [Dactylosporangium sp. NBC_01737]|uniref:hypothetical protein n=1 Tax=Dactylosporangium sp. NBC_01737 TaxID=2975959 RepID=UPI002E0F3F44|nr:hypothetical protein OHA72_06045 [Dactylosporangium sp. NBC_01737]
MTPGLCLDAADGLLRRGPSGVWWPKVCACLIRLALELAIEQYWLTTSPQVAACTAQRTRLLMLRRRSGQDLARRAAFAWGALSTATHHHCYDTAPTAGELRRLHTEVGTLVKHLSNTDRRGN